MRTIASILRAGMGFLPFDVSAHGRIGSLMRRFLYGVDPLPSPDFTDGRIHAVAADRLARSYKVPHGLLKRADFLWRRHPGKFYGDSYKAMTPSQYFDQKLGLVISTAVSAHLLCAHHRVHPLGPVRCLIDTECQCDEKRSILPSLMNGDQTDNLHVGMGTSD